MAKGITKRAKQEVANPFAAMLEDLCRTQRGWLPERLYVEMRVRWRSSRGGLMEKDAPLLELDVPPPILYNTDGRLSGEVQGHHISMSHDGEGHFRGVLNGKPYKSLSQKFVEEKLKIQVQIKKSGSQAGYPSEPVPRAVWRRLVDRYNEGDPTVHYERSTE